MLEVAKQRADLIITTGGLGPTADDLTKETIAAAFGKGLVRDEESMARLREHFKGRTMTQNNENRPMCPKGARCFKTTGAPPRPVPLKGKGAWSSCSPARPGSAPPLFGKR